MQSSEDKSGAIVIYLNRVVDIRLRIEVPYLTVHMQKICMRHYINATTFDDQRKEQ